MATEELGLIMKECGFQRHRAELVPNQSGSAPPSMEGSFAAFRNHLIEQKLSVNSSLDDVRITSEDFESEEQLPSDLAYSSNCFANKHLNHHKTQHISSFRNNQRFTSADDSSNGSLDFSRGSLSSHKEESEEHSPPLRASQDLDENSVAATTGKSIKFPANCHKSLVDLRQEDFPRKPSPVYNQYSSSGHTKTNELADYDVNAISLNSSSVNKTPEPGSLSINCPDISSLNPCSCEMIPSNVPLSTSFPTSLHLDETGEPLKDESGDKYANVEFSSGLETHRVDSRTSLEIKRKHEKQQSYRKNVPRLRMSIQEDIPYQAQGYQCRTISQGMHQLPGFTPPLYAEPSAYMASGNHFFPNLLPTNLYALQYSLPGYAPGSALFPTFMASYPSHSFLPFPSSPSYIGITTDVTTREGIPHIGDTGQQSKFYGRHVSMPQPSLANHLHMQYYPHPSQQVYGSLVQHAQLASSAVIGSQFAQPESTSSAQMGDQMFHLPPNGSLNVSAPRKMEISGYGNPPFVNAMTQLPASSLPSPIMPSSPVGGGSCTGQQSEMRFLGTYSGWQEMRGFSATDEPKKLSLFEELKSSNYQKLELSNIEGRIIEFSIDQHGSRFIQQKLEHCSAKEKTFVFNEVVPHASRLMVDVFGNYVIQKLFEHGTAEQRKELADKLSGQMLSLSLQMYGCRVIQKALEVIELDQKSLLVKELDGHVMHCVQDQNGNHVIQKCIEILPTVDVGFIISSFQGHVPKLASDPYGCRVIQRVLEHCLVDIQCQCIVKEILESACILAQDQYGNYVIQYILECGKPHERSQIISKLSGRIVQMSKQKYGSNVVEKCLKYGNPTEQEHLIEEILEHSEENDNLLAMMKDQYANYVVQKMFETSNDKQKEILHDRTRVHLCALRKYTYGKHIAARFERLSIEEPEVA